MKLILGFAACSSLQQLGYDPSVRRLPPTIRNPKPAYEIDVFVGPGRKIRTFITRRILTDFGADAMHGRGTRVWVVVDKTDPDGREYVLKDCWIDSDRQTEGSILELIRHVRLVPSDDLPNDLDSGKQHFLSVECHGNVLIPAKNYNYLDQTLKYHRGGKELNRQRDVYTQRQPSAALIYAAVRYSSEGILILPSATSTGDTPTFNPTLPPSPNVTNRNMQHYRIVFDAVATGFTQLNSFKIIFTVLRDVINGTLMDLYCTSFMLN